MIPWTWSKLRSRHKRESPQAEDHGDRRLVFEELARENARSLYGAALRMTNNSEEAQDLAQESLALAFAAFDSFQIGTNFRAWVLRIMTNQYIIAYRRSRLATFHSWDDLTERDDRTLQGAHHSHLPSPDSALFANAFDEEIEVSLARLSEGVRLTVLLVDVEQLSYEEAALALGVPIGTVRSRLNRGRGQMRDFLAVYARERRLV